MTPPRLCPTESHIGLCNEWDINQHHVQLLRSGECSFWQSAQCRIQLKSGFWPPATASPSNRIPCPEERGTSSGVLVSGVSRQNQTKQKDLAWLIAGSQYDVPKLWVRKGFPDWVLASQCERIPGTPWGMLSPVTRPRKLLCCCPRLIWGEEYGRILRIIV